MSTPVKTVAARAGELGPRPVRTLFLDPSSTCSGYAVLDSTGRILDAGLLKPDKTRLPALHRARTMAREAWHAAHEHGVRQIVIEIPDGHVHSKKTTGGYGLSIYGMAAGVIWACLEFWGGPSGVEVVTVGVSEWTTGGGSKADRAAITAYRHPELKERLAEDSGLDMVDAVGLGDWWMDKRQGGRE